MPTLLLLTGPSTGLRREVTREVVLGRSPSCDIPLDDSKVSRRHVSVSVEGSTAKVRDLGSRNGTLVNGGKIDGETVLLPGDLLQVGDTTIVFEPSASAALTEQDGAGEIQMAPVAELLPVLGFEASLVSCGTSLLSATSEAMVLRRAAFELSRAISADIAAALLGGTEGLLTAAVVGAKQVEVPRAWVKAAFERQEATCRGGRICAPMIASGGSSFGILFSERDEAFPPEALKIAAALGKLTGEAFAALRAQKEPLTNVVTLTGVSKPFRKMLDQVRRACATDFPVLLFGEPGSGRLHQARYIHARSSRALGPFVVVDCRRSIESVEQDLFGRAPLGNQPPIPSALLRADGGTLLLRRIDALPAILSSKLFKYLSAKVGPAQAGGEEAVDLRVIATSNTAPDALASGAELDRAIARFFEKTTIESVALRERLADISVLFEHFMSPRNSGLRTKPPWLSADAMRRLEEYAWPGNVDELRMVADRLCMLYPGVEITPLQLPQEIQESVLGTNAPTLLQRVQRLEKDAIEAALKQAHGKKLAAANSLGISRPTLDKKIEDFQIVVQKKRRR